jgi:hypothetical protein
MTEPTCSNCQFFSPAQTCIEKPTWGHCSKLTARNGRERTQQAQPLFTWADDMCPAFEARSQSARCT